MKPYRFWLLLIAGLIVILFMFGRLVRGVRAAEGVRILFPTDGPTNFLPNAYFATNAETIYFQTNVLSGDNASGCEMFNPVFGCNLNHNILNHTCTPRVPATERWWTTNIQQISKLKLIWRGEPETIVRIKNVTNVTVRSKLKQEWSEPEADKVISYYNILNITNLVGAETKTNWLNRDLFLTNGVYVYSNLWIEGHLVKIITNKRGGITIEGLPENKGTK